MKIYRPRIADEELKRKLEAFGAVSIVGPKWCGKTTTAEQVAKSAIYMQDTDMAEEYKRMMRIKPSLLLEGEKPRLIDEWQMEPGLWDTVRYSVDKLSKEGLYILTGSVAIDESKIEHSGAGRIGRMKMSTMSLYESGDSTGEASLKDMFSGREVSGNSVLSIEDVAAALIRGGWPNSIGKRPSIAYDHIEGYCEAILKSEVKMV
ncbi:MAG: AAA family ATPase, partial [Methanomassiliicoccaceae archaeon]|nr:AAA family ATPase [Methanomassiliicoccaceae archaeon]